MGDEENPRIDDRDETEKRQTRRPKPEGNKPKQTKRANP